MGDKLTPQRKAAIARMLMGIPEPKQPTFEELMDELMAEQEASCPIHGNLGGGNYCPRC